MPDALVIRTTAENGEAYGGFMWPCTVGAVVEAPDWDPRPVCGGGLHGLLDGFGNFSYLSDSSSALWWLVEVMRSECVTVEGDKVKFPRCRVVYVGHPGPAIIRIAAEFRAEFQRQRDAIFAEVAASPNTQQTAGEAAHSSTAAYAAHSSTAGEAAHSSTAGEAAHSSTAGYAAHSSTAGNRAHSSTAGNRAHSSTSGRNAIAVALGPNSRAKAGVDGWIVCTAWRIPVSWDPSTWEIVHVRTAKVGGPEGIKADTFYALTIAGEFVEVADA